MGGAKDRSTFTTFTIFSDFDESFFFCKENSFSKNKNNLENGRVDFYF